MRSFYRKKPPKKKSKRKMKRPRLQCTVYGLYDGDFKLRYIGQTRTRLSLRFKYYKRNVAEHQRKGWNLSPVLLWLATCFSNNKAVFINAIDKNATWDVSEIIYIERARCAGADLLNVLRGGSDTFDALVREDPNFLRMKINSQIA